MFSTSCSAEFVVKSVHARKKPSGVHGIVSTDKNCQISVPPVPLNVEAFEFPYKGNSQFNIFAKVFVCQMGTRDWDTCCYIDNAGTWHKYDSSKQCKIKLKNYGNCHNDSQSVYVGCNGQNDRQQQVNADNIKLCSHESCSVGPGGHALGLQSSVILDKQILISSIGGELFSEEGTHSTCSWEQFEYQADCHQMSPSKDIIETLVSVVGPPGPTELQLQVHDSTLPWVQDVEGNGVWCDSINFVCKVSGFEDNNCIVASHPDSVHAKLFQSTGGGGLQEKYNPMLSYSEHEGSGFEFTGSIHDNTSYINPGPGQNTPTCIYSRSYFSLSISVDDIMGTGTFGDVQLSCNTAPKVVYSDMTPFSLNIIQAVKRFSVQHAYCRSVGVLLLNTCQFTQYSGSQLLNSNDMKSWVIEAHTVVKNTATSNYKQARLVVPSGLKVTNWRRYLQYYDIKVLCDYLEFGFPLKVDRQIFQFNTNVSNHSSARFSTEGVDRYFTEEIGLGAMVGPFQKQPFEKIHVSPLMARPKPDGGTRVIVDLSWPLECSVNSCVPLNNFDGMDIQLKYPTVDNLVEKIRKYGPDTLLFKVDLQRAFRNLRIDPGDYDLLGLNWRQQTYIDVAMPFGFRQGASSCQFCTDAIVYLMTSQRHWVMAYLDDLIGAALPARASDAFATLINLLQHLGLPINYKKVEAPSSQITCLGIIVDAKAGTLSVPAEKLEKIKQMCTQWLGKIRATRKQIQKLLGHLLYIHKCIPPARLFTNRILQTLRSTPRVGYVKLSPSFHKDITWFCVFLEYFNGTVKIHPSVAVHCNHIFVDASLRNLGAIFQRQVYSIPIIDTLKQFFNIVHFEATNILLAIRTWLPRLHDQECTIWCDNNAVVNAFTFHKIKDNYLMACVRSVWLLCAQYNIKLKVSHIRGTCNQYADILSRWDSYVNCNMTEVQFLKACTWLRPNAQEMIPNFQV